MTMSLRQIDEGAEALCDNAAELIREARTLYGIEAYARAYALAHLAREELSKSFILTSTGARILGGENVDWPRLMKRLRDHKAKLRMEMFDVQLQLKAEGHDEVPNIFFRGGGSAMVDVQNDLKNSALYVGFIDGLFVRPRDTRTAHQALRTIEISEARHYEIDSMRRAIGPLANMKLGSIKPPKRFDPSSMTEDDLLGLAVEMAVIREMVVEKLKAQAGEVPGSDASKT